MITFRSDSAVFIELVWEWEDQLPSMFSWSWWHAQNPTHCWEVLSIVQPAGFVVTSVGRRIIFPCACGIASCINQCSQCLRGSVGYQISKISSNAMPPKSQKIISSGMQVTSGETSVQMIHWNRLWSQYQGFLSGLSIPCTIL